LALAVVSAVVVWRAFRAGRSLYFAEGVVAAYLGSLRLLFEALKATPFRIDVCPRHGGFGSGRAGAHRRRAPEDERALRAESAAFERAAAVRGAARRWQAAGLIDGRTEEAIEGGFPDPRIRPSAVWRVLTFLLVTVIVLGALLALALSGVREAKGAALVCLLVGGRVRRRGGVPGALSAPRRRGGAGATAFWAELS